MKHKPLTNGEDYLAKVAAQRRRAKTGDVQDYHFPPSFLISTQEMKCYERLKADPRTQPVIQQMLRWGLSSDAIDELFRNIACLKTEWEAWHERPEQYRKRRQRLAQTLLELADAFEHDPELRRTLFFQADNYPYDPTVERRYSSHILRYMADDAKPSEWSPNALRRKMPFQTWAARILCNEIVRLRANAGVDPFAAPGPTSEVKRASRVYRAPNQETATLLSVAFGLKVTSETVTQARKGVRRRYVREL